MVNEIADWFGLQVINLLHHSDKPSGVELGCRLFACSCQSDSPSSKLDGVRCTVAISSHRMKNTSPLCFSMMVLALSAFAVRAADPPKSPIKPKPDYDYHEHATAYSGPGREAPEPGDVREVLLGYFGPRCKTPPARARLVRQPVEVRRRPSHANGL
jgi:hypothetical protein